MTALAKRLVSEPDGMGGVRHVLVAANDLPAQGRRRRGRPAPDPLKAAGDAAAQTLRQFIERLEFVNQEIAELSADKRDILSEAKSQGYDTTTMLKIVAMRQLDKHALDEAEALFETYRAALGLN